MWAVCFTDLVGSTEQRARLGDDAGDALRREHDAIVVRAAGAHGGQIVKGTGDGAMVAFSGAAEAIAAGVTMQQLVERRNGTAPEPLGLRVGISLGDLLFEAGDLHGLAANEAARVCALAEPGEVLVTDLARAVAGTRNTAQLVAYGEHSLKGLPAAVTVWRACWSPLGEAKQLELPALLNSAGAMAFAGRADESAVMTGALQATLAGARRLVLISGEPGIGKTRLAAETAIRAHQDGALVLFGRCDDEMGVPFQPFTEALDWYLTRSDQVVLGKFPGDLARLSPRVNMRVPETPSAVQADPDTEQYRLFDAVASWFATAADEQPLVLVLDDLHWATKPTLLMLRHVIRSLDATRVMVIATYRDTDLDRGHPLGGMLAEFRRLGGVERVVLSGLDEDGVTELLERISEQRADEQARELAAALVSETEGNPFFIGEVIRHLVETRSIVQHDGRWTSDVAVADLGIPEGIKEVLGQRLDMLGQESTDVLRAAAVVGREFRLADVTAAMRATDDEVITAIEPALRARLVEETGRDHFRFAHALVRAALLDEVSTSRRLRLHRRIAEHFEAHGAEPGAVAHHWLESASSADPDRAVAAVLASADLAIARGAYEDAVLQLLRGIEFTEENEVDSAHLRELGLHLGQAQQLAGDPAGGDTLRATFAACEAAGDADRLARALIATSRGTAVNTGFVDTDHVARHFVALEALGPRPTRERALLLASLAGELDFEFDDRRIEYVAEAERIARSLGDPGVLFTVLLSRSNVTFPDPDEQDALAQEFEEIRDLIGPRERLRATQALHLLHMYRGDMERARTALDEARAALDQSPVALSRWLIQCHEAKMAGFEGRLDAAELGKNDALAYGLDAGFADAGQIWLSLDIGLSRDLGRAAERIALYRELIDSRGGTPPGSMLDAFMSAVYAVLHVDAGNYEDANRLLTEQVQGDLPVARTRNLSWLVYAYCLAETAAILDRADVAAVLYDLLSPYQGRTASAATVCNGYVDRPLGRLATTLGRFEDAHAHLNAAANVHERAGAPLFLARTLADHAALELASNGNTGRARELAHAALDIASEQRAPGVQEYVRRTKGLGPL